MDLLRRAAIATLPLVPVPLLRKVAQRYVAGERLEDAIAVLQDLQRRGFTGIVDLLGEEVSDAEASRGVVRDYTEAARAVQGAALPAYVSVKPTHVGVHLSEDLAHENYDALARSCAELGLFLRVEMEDHRTTDATLRVFERLRAEHPHVGLVLQSRLRRTLDDIRALGPGPLDVRMVKGIYLEPEEIAHTEPDAIRDAFVDCCRLLFERGARIGLATHDDVLTDRCLALVDELDVPPERRELQVLLGVREPLWKAWRAAGLPVRVYVPYGPEWRAYSLRRLRSNPQIFSHVLRDVLLPGR